MASTDAEEIRATAYVGFDTITQQIEHKLLKRGFQFNVIVVGKLRQMRLCLVGSLCLFLSFQRSNWSGKVDVDQHHFRIPLDRLKRSSARG